MSICAFCDSLAAPEPLVLGDRTVFGLCLDCQLEAKAEAEEEAAEDAEARIEERLRTETVRWSS